MIPSIDHISSDVMKGVIIPRLSLKSAARFASTCKKQKKIVDESTLWVQELLRAKVQLIDPAVHPKEQLRLYCELDQPYSLHAHVARQIGPVAFFKLPVLNLRNRVGHTEYIDFVRAKHMSAPIMRGIDPLQRPFIALRYVNRQTDPAAKRVDVIFHRRTGGGTWVFGSNCNGTGALFGTCSQMMNERTIDLMNRLITRQNIGHSSYDSHSLSYIEGERTLNDGRSIIELS